MVNGDIIAIIRLFSNKLDQMQRDSQIFRDNGFKGVEFEIPRIKVVSKITKEGTFFKEKPLLLNYGFVRIPIEYAKNPSILRDIRDASEVIMGFFYRKKDDITLEVEVAKEVEGLDIIPILVEDISSDELASLYAEASKIDLYDSNGGVTEGSYIILKNYPFDGLGAKVLRTKPNGKTQVELISTGIKVWLDPKYFVYTVYDQPINEYEL